MTGFAQQITKAIAVKGVKSLFPLLQFGEVGGEAARNGLAIVAEDVGPHLFRAAGNPGGVAKASSTQLHRTRFPAKDGPSEGGGHEMGQVADPRDQFIVTLGRKAGNDASQRFPKGLKPGKKPGPIGFGSEDDGRVLEEAGIGVREPFFLRPGHGMASDKNSPSLADEGSDFTNDRRLDAADVRDEDLRSGRKATHLPDDGGHVSGRHRQDEAIGALDRLIDHGGGQVDKTGFPTEFFHSLGTAGPSGQGGARTTGTQGPEERPPDQPGSEHGDPAKRGFAFGAQGTLK